MNLQHLESSISDKVIKTKPLHIQKVKLFFK